MSTAILTRTGRALRPTRASVVDKARSRQTIGPGRQFTNQTRHGGGHNKWYGGSQAALTGGLVMGALLGGILYVSTKHRIFASRNGRMSLLPDAPKLVLVSAEEADGDIPIESPVKVLDMAAANAKLRQNVQTFTFESTGGTRGRIDVARVPSNCPVEDDWSVLVGTGPGKHQMVYAGVYDGHAGWATSTVLRETLIPHVASALAKLDQTSPNSLVDTAIRTAFTKLDDRIMSQARNTVESHNPGAPEALSALAPAVAGSCALLTMYDPVSSVLRTAVTGDSRAVLGSFSPSSGDFTASALSVDQNGFNKEEVARLNKDHPGEEDMLDPRTGRLLGMAITRAFGDHRWKYPLDLLEHLEAKFYDSGPRPRYKTPPYMTAEPEVTTRHVNSGDFAILATDGLWDHISNEDAVACVSRWLAARRAGQVEKASGSSDERPADLTVAREGFGSWRATPEHFSIEDLDSAAVCLVRNAFGGNRRELFRGVMTETSPRSRYVRDDVTVQVIFFKDPYQR